MKVFLALIDLDARISDEIFWCAVRTNKYSKDEDANYAYALSVYKQSIAKLQDKILTWKSQQIQKV